MSIIKKKGGLKDLNCIICFDKIILLDETDLNYNILCKEETHNVCKICLTSIINCLVIRKGYEFDISILKCPLCHIYNYSKFYSINLFVIHVVNELLYLYKQNVSAFEKKKNMLLKINITNETILFTCFKCYNLFIKEHQVGNCANDINNINNGKNVVCGKCTGYDRVVICTICKIPVIKQIVGYDTKCNHIICANGHHVCAYFGCGAGFYDEDELWDHKSNKSHYESRKECSKIKSDMGLDLLEEYFKYK